MGTLSEAYHDRIAELERSRDIALNSIRCWQKDYRLLEEKLAELEKVIEDAKSTCEAGCFAAED